MSSQRAQGRVAAIKKKFCFGDDEEEEFYGNKKPQSHQHQQKQQKQVTAKRKVMNSSSSNFFDDDEDDNKDANSENLSKKKTITNNNSKKSKFLDSSSDEDQVYTKSAMDSGSDSDTDAKLVTQKKKTVTPITTTKSKSKSQQTTSTTTKAKKPISSSITNSATTTTTKKNVVVSSSSIVKKKSKTSTGSTHKKSRINISPVDRILASNILNDDFLLDDSDVEEDGGENEEKMDIFGDSQKDVIDYSALMDVYFSIYPENSDCSRDLVLLLKKFIKSISTSKEFQDSVRYMIKIFDHEEQSSYYSAANMYSSTSTTKRIHYEEEEMKYHILMMVAAVFTRFISRRPDALLECFNFLKNRPSGQPLSKRGVIKILSLYPQVLPLSVDFLSIDMRTAQIPKNKTHPLERVEFVSQDRYIDTKMRSRKQLEIRMTIISISALMREVIIAFKNKSCYPDGVDGITEKNLVEWSKIADITMEYVQRKKVTERVGFSVPVFFKELKSHSEELRMMILQLAAVLYNREDLKKYMLSCVRNMRKLIIHVVKGGYLSPENNTAHQTVAEIDEVFTESDGNNTPMPGLDSVELVPYGVQSLILSAIKASHSDDGNQDSYQRMFHVLLEKFKMLSMKMFGTIINYMGEYWDIDVVWESNDRNSWDLSNKSKQQKNKSGGGEVSIPIIKREPDEDNDDDDELIEDESGVIYPQQYQQQQHQIYQDNSVWNNEGMNEDYKQMPMQLPSSSIQQTQLSYEVASALMSSADINSSSSIPIPISSIVTTKKRKSTPRKKKGEKNIINNNNVIPNTDNSSVIENPVPIQQQQPTTTTPETETLSPPKKRNGRPRKTPQPRKTKKKNNNGEQQQQQPTEEQHHQIQQHSSHSVVNNNNLLLNDIFDEELPNSFESLISKGLDEVLAGESSLEPEYVDAKYNNSSNFGSVHHNYQNSFDNHQQQYYHNNQHQQEYSNNVYTNANEYHRIKRENSSMNDLDSMRSRFAQNNNKRAKVF